MILFLSVYIGGCITAYLSTKELMKREIAKYPVTSKPEDLYTYGMILLRIVFGLFSWITAVFVFLIILTDSDSWKNFWDRRGSKWL